MGKLLAAASRFFLLCAVVLMLPAAVSAQSVTLQPDSGPVGTKVTVSGKEWSPNDLIDFCWNFNCDPTDTSVKADGKGTFTGTITVPQNAPIGDTYIVTIQVSTGL